MNALPPSADFAPFEVVTKAPAIRLERLGKTFDPAVGPVLEDVSLTIGQGDIQVGGDDGCHHRELFPVLVAVVEHVSLVVPGC